MSWSTFRASIVVWGALAALAGCRDDGRADGRDGGARSDSGSGRGKDVGTRLDSGFAADAMVRPDGAAADANPDSGQADAEPEDTGIDPGMTDAGFVDGGTSDTGTSDTGAPDDTGVPRADTGVGPADTGVAPADTGGAPADTGVAPSDTGAAADTGAAPADTGVAADAGFAPDATQPADASQLDAGTTPDAGAVSQLGGIVISEIVARGAVIEWIELWNTGAQAVDLRAVSINIGSHAAAGAQTIRAATDPSGGAGTPVSLPANARASGVPNPASGASIPAHAAFVFGGAGTLGADAFADGGDVVSISSSSGVLDRLDFMNAATDPTGPVAAGAFPVLDGASMQLDFRVPAAGAETANDSGDVWCAPVFRAPTPGAVNLDCAAFVISELLYDYDSLSTSGDEGEEFIEIAGAAGGSLHDVRVVQVQGASASAGSIIAQTTLSGTARMPANGLYVLADDNGMGATQVANVDQIANLDFQNGPDAVQLVRVQAGAQPVLLDALGYGTLTPNLVDTSRSLPAYEGTTVGDWNTVVHAIDWARSDSEADTGNNAADFFHDPSPTPGQRNGTSVFTLSGIDPNDAIATRTATATLRGNDFTDGMSVTIGTAMLATSACTFTEANALRCQIPYPAGGSGMPERVAVAATTRAEHGAQTHALPAAFTWTNSMNETNDALEIDYCNIQFPATLTMTLATSQTSMMIFGRTYQAGVTNPAGASAMINAEVGYGPSGSDPRSSNAWQWFPAAFNLQYGNDDEYMGQLTVTTAGSYAYTLRFTLDGGLTWTYADRNGAGSNSGLNFEVGQLGALTANP